MTKKHGGFRENSGRNNKFAEYGYNGECKPIRLIPEFEERYIAITIEWLKEIKISSPNTTNSDE